MSLTDNIKDSLNYAISNYKTLLIFGVIILLSEITGVFNALGIDIGVLYIILAIVAFVFSLIVNGYNISIINATLNRSSSLPEFDFKENIIVGIKAIIMYIVYAIIPIVIAIVLFALFGGFDTITSILANAGANGTVTVNSITNSITQSQLNSLGMAAVVSGVVSIIIGVLFAIASYMGAARLAETGSLADACNIFTSIKEIGSIGWIDAIAWFIVLMIVVIILNIVSGIFTYVPYVGILISTIVIESIINIFMSRSIGLIYLNA